MTFFNRESEWSFYMEEIFSLNNNLLINNDVSLNGNLNVKNTFVNGNINIGNNFGIKFNDGTTITNGNISSTSVGRVTISGNLHINGSLGVLDSSTNDISYGSVGAVLTSNGVGGEPPRWERPYFIKAMLETEDDTGLADKTDYILDGLVAQFSGTDFDYNNIDWDKSSCKWTCRETGIYRINAQVAFRLTSSGADRIRLCQIDIYNGETIVASNKMEIEGTDSGGDDFKEYNSVVNSLLKYDIDHTMTMKLSWEIRSSEHTMRIIATGDKTFLQIEKVA